MVLIKSNYKDHVIHGLFNNPQNAIKSMGKFLERVHHVKLAETTLCIEFKAVYCHPLINFLVKHECHRWLEMPVNLINSLGLQRGRKDRSDAHCFALCFINEFSMCTNP